MAETAHDLQTVLDAIKGEGRWRPEKQGVITNSFGNISNIAARLGVQRQTVYNYKKKWKAVESAIHEALEMRKDFVEDRMLRRVMDGSDTMMIFFAKTQMKDRGYVERQEISLTWRDRAQQAGLDPNEVQRQFIELMKQAAKNAD